MDIKNTERGLPTGKEPSSTIREPVHLSWAPKQDIRLPTGKEPYFTIREPVHLSWAPKQDITTLELARCLPLLVGATHNVFPGDAVLEEDFMRHFEVV